MRSLRSPALLLILTCAFGTLQAQTKPPIKVETFPANSELGDPQGERLSSLRTAGSMNFAAPLLLDAPGTVSTLVLANVSTATTTAIVTFFSKDGRSSSRKTVTLEPHGKTELPLANGTVAGTDSSAWGSVMVEQKPGSDAVIVAGQIILTDHRTAIPSYLDQELAMPETDGSSTLRAVTDESLAPPLVAVTNFSDAVQKATLNCLQGRKQIRSSVIEIGARATITGKACDGVAANVAEYLKAAEQDPAPGVYGVEIAGTGDPGSLVAFGVAPHHRGYDLILSAVPFYDPQTIYSAGTVFAGVPVGSQEALPLGVYVPHLSLANFGEQPIKFTVSLADTKTSPARSSDGILQAPFLSVIRTVVLPAHQTDEVAFTGQEAQSGLLHSILMTSNGAPGTYQAKLVARSTGSLYQVEMLAKELLDRHNTGVHPWTVAGDAESHILLFNHKGEESKVGVFITSGTSVWSKEFYLAPLETREISINKIESEQIPDDHGQRLHAQSTDGVINWMSPDPGAVTGRLMVTSRTDNMARSYSCGSSVGVCGLTFSTYYNNLIEGNTDVLYTASAQMCVAGFGACTVKHEPAGGTAAYTWTVTTSSIVGLNTTADGTKTNPTLKGIGAGQGKAYVSAYADGCSASGSGFPTVQVPDHIVVQMDQSNTINCGSAGLAKTRDLTYNILDSGNNQIQRIVALFETTNPSTVNSCNSQPIGTTFECTASQQPGNFTDHLSTGCPSSAAIAAQGCGFTVPDQKWEWCGPAYVSIGDIGSLVVDNNYISVQGNSSGLPVGTTFPK